MTICANVIIFILIHRVSNVVFGQAGVEADDLEDLYEKVHEAIRSNPVLEKKERKPPAEKKHWKAVRLTYAERKERLLERLSMLKEAADEED